MLRIKTKIGPSGIHGIGLFADQFVPKGTVTWQYDPEIDLSITKQQLDALSPLSKDFFLFYTYFDQQRELYILPSDHLRFINHSVQEEKRNIASTPDQDVASRDIQPGEELFCDYNKFDDTYFGRHNLDAKDLL